MGWLVLYDPGEMGETGCLFRCGDTRTYQLQLNIDVSGE